jgi:hypothetical protein
MTVKQVVRNFSENFQIWGDAQKQQTSKIEVLSHEDWAS